MHFTVMEMGLNMGCAGALKSPVMGGCCIWAVYPVCIFPYVHVERIGREV